MKRPPTKSGKRPTKNWPRAELTTQGILKKFKVKVVCTTDDPADNLEHHRAFASQGHPTKMLPAFRPDKALTVNQPASFNKWVEQLAAASNVDINSFSAFVTALKKRHDFFHSQGCRLSDHGLNHCFADFCSEKTAADIFDKARHGEVGFPAGTRPIRLVPDAVFRPARRRTRLDEAASPRRVAQR